jgi:exosortase A
VKLESLQLPRTVAAQTPNLLKGEILLTALVLSGLFWLLAWYWDTALAMISIWERSDTFAHGFLIVPISGWLIWRKRHVLAALDLRPNFLALPLLALAGFGWLLAGLGGVGVVQQFSLVVMIPLAVWVILGTEAVRALAFPLVFLVFAVPFGEFLEPPLMEHTANFTVAALKLSGIPVYREGQFFTIPSGSWSVVEACSGLRYLIASVTLGLLYAYLTYRSFARRALFVAASIVVPIVANWLRAYMIVMIGHLSSMQYAVGIDHLIYGWLFFGLVMLMLFWVGSYWREDSDTAQPLRPAVPPPGRARSMAAITVATIAGAAMAAVWPVAAGRLEMGGTVTPELKPPQASGAWKPVDEGHVSSFRPRFFNYQAHVNQAYTDGTTGAELWIVYYRNQRPGAQLISTQNTIVSSNDREWRKTGEGARALIVGKQEIPLIEARLRSPSAQLLVWRWYWVDGRYVVNPYWAKLLQAKSMLFGGDDDGAMVIVYTLSGDRLPSAEQPLQDFVEAMLPGITRSLEHARRARSAS